MRKLLLVCGFVAFSASALANHQANHQKATVVVTPNAAVAVHHGKAHHRHHARHRHHGRGYCRVTDPRGRVWVKRGGNSCARALADCRHYHVRHNYHDYRGMAGGRCFVVR